MSSESSNGRRAPSGRSRSSENKATIVTYRDDFAIKEITELAEAAGYSVQAVLPQKVVLKSEYGVGVGKAAELFEIVSDNDSKTLIVDEELTSSQANNLSKVTHVEVVDRRQTDTEHIREESDHHGSEIAGPAGGAQVRDASRQGRRPLFR